MTGVSASAELISRAIEQHADLIVVHHGLVWGGGLTRIAGPLAQRLKLLLGNGVSLAAYHLPLDKHPRLGNNVGLADALALGAQRETFGDVRGIALGVAGAWPTPLTRDEAIGRIAGGVGLGQPPRFVFPYGPEVVRKIGLCSGAASDLLEAAAGVGCDLFLTGELAERAGDLATRAADHAGRRWPLRDRGVRPDARRRRAADEVPRRRGPVRAIAVAALAI